MLYPATRGEQQSVVHERSEERVYERETANRLDDSPDAAVQPMSGGMAPTTAPTQVLAALTTLRGV